MADDTNKTESGADSESSEHSAERNQGRGDEDQANAASAADAADTDDAASAADAADTDDAADTEGAAGAEDAAAKRGKRPGDDLDPELLALPRAPRGRVGPVLAISVIVFCVFIMVRIYGDLRFSRSAGQPVFYESPAALLQNAELEDLVEVQAVPDRTLAFKIAHSQADDGSRLTPVQGTSSKLWLMIGGNVWSVPISYKEVYSGRLRGLDDLPFADELRAQVRKSGPIPHFVTATAARQALEAGAAAVSGPAGDTFPVSADTPVKIYETVADRARIQVFATERHPGESDWTAALIEIGLVPPGYQPQAGQNESWIYFVQVPGGAEAAQRALHEAKLFSARADAIDKVAGTTWGKLAASPGGDALMAGDTRLVWSNVNWVQIDVPGQVPDDALVLLTQEHPDAYWYVLPLFALLGLFAVLFLWALVRSLLALRR